MTIENLFVYPVKSMSGIAMQDARIYERGIVADRVFMLRDEGGRFMSQRDDPRLALFSTEMESDELVIRYRPDGKSIRVPVKPESSMFTESVVWDDRCLSVRLNEEYDAFFTSILGRKAELVFMPDTAVRKVDSRYADAITSFTDGYPVLVIGTASLDKLNEELRAKGEKPVSWDRFRPGMVVRTTTPFEEDLWCEFTVGDIRFRSVKPCSRCIMTCVDQVTGVQGKEPLKTLSEFRRFDSKINFGINVIPLSFEGMIRQGDKVVVESFRQ